MKKPKVIDIVMLSSYGKHEGGKETWLHNFLPELLKDDSIVKVYLFGFRIDSQPDQSEFLKSLDPEKKRVIPVILKSAPTKYPKFISMFRLLSRKIDVNNYIPPTHAIAVGGVFETLMLRFISRFKNATRIVWLRSIFTQEKAYVIPSYAISIFKYFEKNNLKKTADIIIVNGDDTKIFYSQYNLVIHTIKNSVNVGKWKMPSMQPSNVLQVAFVGRLSKVKGIESYFKLAEKIKNSKFSSNFIFHVVGEANNYDAIISKLHEDSIVVYHGAIDNDKLPIFLKKIHVCVALGYVSKRLGGAGLSNALIEQMAAAKIIVAWDNVAYNQILDESCAYKVVQYDIDHLVNTLVIIYNNQGEALQRARNAQKVVSSYTIEEHVKKFKKLLYHR